VSSALSLKLSTLGLGWVLSKIGSILSAEVVFPQTARASTDDEAIPPLHLGGKDTLLITLSSGNLVLDPMRVGSHPSPMVLDVYKMDLENHNITSLATINFTEHRRRVPFTESGRPLLFVTRLKTETGL
jgi:hypothetical protein